MRGELSVRGHVRMSEAVVNRPWARQAPSWPSRCKEIWMSHPHRCPTLNLTPDLCSLNLPLAQKLRTPSKHDESPRSWDALVPCIEKSEALARRGWVVTTERAVGGCDSPVGGTELSLGSCDPLVADANLSLGYTNSAVDARDLGVGNTNDGVGKTNSSVEKCEDKAGESDDGRRKSDDGVDENQ